MIAYRLSSVCKAHENTPAGAVAEKLSLFRDELARTHLLSETENTISISSHSGSVFCIGIWHVPERYAICPSSSPRRQIHLARAHKMSRHESVVADQPQIRRLSCIDRSR